MSQETTKEFSARLNIAVEGHPLAPESVFGRQAWLREKLKREARIDVSPNAIHKWTGGMAKPREDNIRAIAKVLNVDELWLSMGRTPVSADKTSPKTSAGTNAATLVLGGMIEMFGGRVIFPGRDDPAHIRATVAGKDIGILVVSPEWDQGPCLATVSEPVGDLRIVAVSVAAPKESGPISVDVVNLTAAPRQNFGGFSLVQIERRKDGRFKVEGLKNLLTSMSSVDALVE